MKLIFVIASCAVAYAAIASDFVERLQRLTPDYPAPPLEVLEEPAGQPLPVALVGLSFEQAGKRLTGDRPIVNGETPVTVIAYWRARVRMNARVAGELSFWDHLALIRVEENIRVGPADADKPWEVGGVYTTSHTVETGQLARQFSGDATMVAAIRGPAGASRQLEPRQLVPIRITPTIRPSNVSADDVIDAFSEESRYVAQSVRLSRGATATIPIEEPWRDGNRRIAVFSYTSYRSPDQGEIACTITVNPGSGAETSFALNAGAHTSLRNYDALPEATRNHQKAHVFSSTDSGQVGEDGAPIRLHTYVAEFELPPEIESIDAIAFSCPASTLIDVEGFVLLP